MGGFLLDIYIEFLVRVVLRFFRRRGSTRWPVVKAKISSAKCRPGGLGCDVVDVTYKYRVDGELHAGDDHVPFVSANSAREYVEDHPAGSELIVRVKTGSHGDSVVRQDDLYRQAHGYRLEVR